MAYDLTGKIKLIQDTKTFGSGFEKREMIVVVTESKYPQEINLEFIQEKVNLLDNVQVGQEVTVTFDIRGREHKGRWFNSLMGWKIQASEVAAPAEDKPPVSEKDVPADFDEYEDDIPF